jgi:hypothetical protein
MVMISSRCGCCLGSAAGRGGLVEAELRMCGSYGWEPRRHLGGENSRTWWGEQINQDRPIHMDVRLKSNFPMALRAFISI